MNTLTQGTHEVIQPEVSLDQCDRCGPAVQAFGLAFKGHLKLQFCGHCTNKFSPALISDGWEVLDYTDRINEKAMSGDVNG